MENHINFIAMQDNERQNRLFTLATTIGWLTRERYRDGTLGLLAECTTIEEFDAVEHVLRNLKYCNSSDLADGALHASRVITQKWNLNPANTILVGLAESNKLCGSTAYVRAIEISLSRDWSSSISPNFDTAFRHRKGKANLIIVDDFIGSGEKMMKKIDALIRNPKTNDYKLHIITFAGMSTGLSLIQEKVEDNLHAHISLEKAISANASEERSKLLTSGMSSLEEKIFSQPGKYSFGYRQSEAAYFLEAANMPNNNFPILWWDLYADEKSRATLFTRR
jgi:hypothetical protein